MIGFDGVFGNNGNGPLKAVNFGLSENFLLVESYLRVVMLLIVNAVHAGSVAALIVDQNEALGTLSADVSENVAFTAENVDVALALVEMVKVSA